MGKHIYIQLHLVSLNEADVLLDPQAMMGNASDAIQQEYEQLRSQAYATYEKAHAEIETYAEQHGGWDYLFDWTHDEHGGAIWSMALAKKADMDKGLLDLVESLRARSVIAGYTIFH